MNRPRNPRPLGWGVGVVAIGALLSWSGCGDDTTLAGGPGAAAGPITVEEADTVFAEDGTVTDELCAVIPAAENVELLCNDGEFCGPGGLCVEPLGRAQGQCSQVCFPELCGNSCPGEETCATLLDGEGQPISFDINRDGTADVVGGACQLDAIGEQGTFESCGAAGACAEGLSAFGSTAGTRAPVSPPAMVRVTPSRPSMRIARSPPQGSERA